MDAIRLAVGDTVWVSQERFTSRTQNRIQPYRVLKVGRQYYTIGGDWEREVRISIKPDWGSGQETGIRHISSGYGAARTVYLREDVMQNRLWLEANKFRIQESVRKVNSIEVLRRIEAILIETGNYEAAP